MAIGRSLRGGYGDNSGCIFGQTVGPITLSWNLEGGSGVRSGIITTSRLASVTIGGAVVGGSRSESGLVRSYVSMGPVTVAGSVVGGGGSGNTIDAGCGGIYSGGSMGVVKIGGSLTTIFGFTGQYSGYVAAHGNLASVTIGGSVSGGNGYFSGFISSGGDMGVISIKGDLQGRDKNSTGYIKSGGKLAGVTIGGSLIGGGLLFGGTLQVGVGDNSGKIESALSMGPITIKGDISGGIGRNSGSIVTNSTLASLTVGGSITGYYGDDSGSVIANGATGLITVAGDVTGGAGARSGVISVNGKLSGLAIGRSLRSEFARDIGPTGLISVSGEISSLSIGGDVIVGIVAAPAYTATISASRIGTLSIGGSLRSSMYDRLPATAIAVKNDIGALTIKGSIMGDSTRKILILAGGQATPTATADLAIGKIEVKGRVEYALFHAGFRTSGRNNADAQIGPVTIGGDWIASSLVAGAEAGIDGQFGTDDDTKLQLNELGLKDSAGVISKITSVVIGGQVIGTEAAGDNFGFVAENIGSFKVNAGTTTYPMSAIVTTKEKFLLSIFTDDLWLNEI